jgi:hypothetical protein
MKRRPQSVILLAALLGVGSVISAPLSARAIPLITSADTQVNQVFPGPFPKNKQNEPSLAQNPANGLNLVAGSNDEIGLPPCTDATPSQCPFTPGRSVSGFYASFDGGQSWPCQGLINLSSFGEYAFGDPAQAFDSRGNVYYATLAFPFPPTTAEVATGQQADFFIAKSTDHGCTYPSAAKASGASPATFDDKDSIAADSNPNSPFRDNVYVAWTRFNFPIGKGGGFGNDQILLARSTDGGATFSTPLPLSPAHNNNTVGGRQGSAVKVGPDGTVYVAWLDTVQKQPVEVVTASHDGGVTFGRPVVAAIVTDDFVSPVPGSSFRQDSRSFPSLAVGPDKAVYVGWSNRTGDGQGTGHAVVDVVKSTDGGATWSAPVKAGDVTGRSAFFASITVDQSGKVDNAFVALDDKPGGTKPGAGVVHYDAYFTQSTDGGATFSSPVKISSVTSDPDGSSTNGLGAQFLGDYITTVADSAGGRAFAVWTDSRGASTCPAVDAFRAGTGPKPDVITQCPTTFGNTDIFLGTVKY